MSTPCYYCELDRAHSCSVCIHGEADADELKENQKDADRYRFLRGGAIPLQLDDSPFSHKVSLKVRTAVYAPQTWAQNVDVAVDVAMRKAATPKD